MINTNSVSIASIGTFGGTFGIFMYNLICTIGSTIFYLDFSEFVVEFAEWQTIPDPRLLASTKLDVLGHWNRKGIAKQEAVFGAQNGLWCGGCNGAFSRLYSSLGACGVKNANGDLDFCRLIKKPLVSGEDSGTSSQSLRAESSFF